MSDNFWKGLMLGSIGGMIFYLITFFGGRYLAELNDSSLWKGMLIMAILMIVLIVMVVGFAMYERDNSK